MNPKAKGELTEILVIARCIQRGYSVSIPFGNNQRYDLIIDRNDRLERIQIKTGRLRGGTIEANCASINGFTGKRTSYEGQIEAFMIYCPDTEEVYRVPIEECGKSTILLRHDPIFNGRTVKWAKDYIL